MQQWEDIQMAKREIIPNTATASLCFTTPLFCHFRGVWGIFTAKENEPKGKKQPRVFRTYGYSLFLSLAKKGMTIMLPIVVSPASTKLLTE